VNPDQASDSINKFFFFLSANLYQCLWIRPPLVEVLPQGMGNLHCLVPPRRPFWKRTLTLCDQFFFANPPSSIFFWSVTLSVFFWAALSFPYHRFFRTPLCVQHPFYPVFFFALCPSCNLGPPSYHSRFAVRSSLVVVLCFLGVGGFLTIPAHFFFYLPFLGFSVFLKRFFLLFSRMLSFLLVKKEGPPPYPPSHGGLILFKVSSGRSLCLSKCVCIGECLASHSLITPPSLSTTRRIFLNLLG